jgi:hypothetical protein
MKNYQLPIIAVALLTGCHLKKKTSEIYTIDQQTVSHTIGDIKTQTNLKVIQIDSSKIIKSRAENLNYSESVKLEFDLIPTTAKSILDKNNVALFEHLVNKSKKVKIHINRTQDKSNRQLQTQQNSIKLKIDSVVNNEGTYKQAQTIDIKEKNKLNSESKTYTALTWWIIATAFVIITASILKS